VAQWARARVFERAGTSDIPLQAAVAHLVTHVSDTKLDQLLSCALGADRGKIDANPKSLLDEKVRDSEIRLKDNGGSHGHYEEFVDSVRTRARTIAPAEVALHSATPGWLGQIAMLTGRKIKWDPVKMQILGDDEAAKLLRRDMRAPYQL